MAVASLRRRVWFRLALFTAGAVLLALLARTAGSALGGLVELDLGQGSVQTLLQILATSMLAVTTFSLTVMVSVYASAAAVATPRATQLLIEDQTSQQALSTFLGAFVFAIVGIAALSTDYYGDDGRIVLYAGTLVVIASVVLTLLHWIQHLVTFGRMADVVDRIEDVACETVSASACRPRLGGAPVVEIPADARPVLADRAGVITRVDIAALDRAAERAHGEVHVLVRAGAPVARGEALARVGGVHDDAAIDAIRDAFTIARHRTYDQDPRLGLVALGEIGSRALSPSTNDPGTAVEVLNSIQRVLTAHLVARPDPTVDHPRVHVPEVAFADLVEDGIRPVARDGAHLVEVAIRVQRVLAGLATVADGDERATLLHASESAEDRAVDALAHPRDVALVRDAAANARRGQAS
ncbi:DUF2254 domain-containing protein [Demequina gelatinilytica]|uniref:DUF2254 domain-containing protein n=1 Tax=Demequina gelatinilytica TaxID=1638980 RepID=UPI0009E259FF|nr:DUF2254 domain-containing protein [Demequina gelatinilytica]